jgi:1,4-dihydroxy-2-naphthoate octaprenyltransferase
MDRDTGSIGVLKNPPPVSRKVYLASIFLDCVGIIICAFIDYRLVVLLLIYSGISRAYSWRGIRLKRFPVAGWLTVILFQGGFTFLMVSMTAENNYTLSWFTPQKMFCIVISTLLIGAYYPLTQIYQHEEDCSRGDFTISYRLGIQGTFIFSAIMFLISFLVCGYYFNLFYSSIQFWIFLACIVPAIIYFFYWMFRSLRNNEYADFYHAMRMTFISSTCLLACYVL